MRGRNSVRDRRPGGRGLSYKDQIRGLYVMSATIDSPAIGEFKLSGGEIHYLYWHIQGSIMVPEIRHALRRARGFCERRAWAALHVETAFRSNFMHGPAILYEDILGLAIPPLTLAAMITRILEI